MKTSFDAQQLSTSLFLLDTKLHETKMELCLQNKDKVQPRTKMAKKGQRKLKVDI